MRDSGHADLDYRTGDNRPGDLASPPAANLRRPGLELTGLGGFRLDGWTSTNHISAAVIQSDELVWVFSMGCPDRGDCHCLNRDQEHCPVSQCLGR